MDRQEMMHLSRLDLLELLLMQSKEIDRLKAQLEEANRKLADRHFVFERCGSLAEAAAAVNGVFEAAQKAADDYLYNVQKMSDGHHEEVRGANTDETVEE